MTVLSGGSETTAEEWGEGVRPLCRAQDGGRAV